MSARNKTKLTLKSPVSAIDGFGKQLTQRASTLGIKTVWDLLTYFPFRYMDYQAKDLSKVANKSPVSISGRVDSIPNRIYHGRMNITTFRLAYDHDRKSASISFFNQPWLVHKVHLNDDVEIYGTYKCNRSQYNPNKVWHNINGKRIKVINTDVAADDIVRPIYPSSHGIKQYHIQQLVKKGYDTCHQLIHNVVPKHLMRKYHLENEAKVIHDIQFPSSDKAEKLARRTAKFVEFYLYESKITKAKNMNTKSKGIAIHLNKKLMRKFYNSLPFKLTSGQLRSVNEIVRNLMAPTQMNRLLQGDVGSGKTVVAAFGILATISAGYQTAIMIPTSVLGEQHYNSFTHMFKGLDVHIVLLTGDMKVKQQRSASKKIADGWADLVIGTDALIQPKIRFKKLGMVVVDEQHKFGVDQRQDLIDKGKGVNALSMTATPIPRTLQMTTYGDMDVSIIDTLPKGRKPVLTRWIHGKGFKSTVPFIRTLLKKGQQVYCVVPLVEQTRASKKAAKDKGSHKFEKLDALTAFNKLQKDFVGYPVGLLHGRMKDDEKAKILKSFKAGKTQVLVSTTVVEVGVDAPKATMMIIFNADNFGLASLHQLRGRVGRNSMQSYCLLVADPKSRDGVKRMLVMEHTTNGFKIAEADLKLRGSGDLFGEAQAGLPKFKVGDVVADSIILKYARIEAKKAAEQPSQQSLF